MPKVIHAKAVIEIEVDVVGNDEHYPEMTAQALDRLGMPLHPLPAGVRIRSIELRET